MALYIRADDLTGKAVLALLARHLDLMRSTSPPEDVHALDLDGLRAPEVSAWTAWHDGTLVGCAALKSLGNRHGEIKSMHVASEARGKGVGAALLRHILDEASRRSLTRLSLETGSTSHFAPARALYSVYGFENCEPFADYEPSKHSTFMTRIVA